MRNPTTSAPSLVLLWFGMLAAPSAWMTHLSVEYFLVTIKCRYDTAGVDLLLHVTTAVLIAVCVAGGLAAWIALRRARALPDKDAVAGRSRFMAMSGLVLTGLFLTMIVFGAIPTFYLDACNAAH